MPVNHFSDYDAPGFNFVKNCLRHDRDPVVIYPEPDDFEDFTLKAGMIGVTAGTDVCVGQLLVNVRAEPDPRDFPFAFSRSGEPLPCYAMHSISMMVHPVAGMWVTRHPMTEAPDGSEAWDVTVSLDELVDLYEVLTELQQGFSADHVLPILASMLNQGSWVTLEPETTVWLPQCLLRNVPPLVHHG